MALLYPVVTMDGPFVHAGSRRNLLGAAPVPALVELMSAEKQVTKDTPPAFHRPHRGGRERAAREQRDVSIKRSGAPVCRSRCTSTKRDRMASARPQDSGRRRSGPSASRSGFARAGCWRSRVRPGTRPAAMRKPTDEPSRSGSRQIEPRVRRWALRCVRSAATRQRTTAHGSDEVGTKAKFCPRTRHGSTARRHQRRRRHTGQDVGLESTPRGRFDERFIMSWTDGGRGART